MKFGSPKMLEVYNNYSSGIFTVRYRLGEFEILNTCNFHLDYINKDYRMSSDDIKTVLQSYILAKHKYTSLFSFEIINFCPDIVKEVSLDYAS